MTASRRIVRSDDEHEDRIRELSLLENDKHAEAISRCCCRGEDPEELLRYRACKLRSCLECTECLAMNIHDEALSAARQFRRAIGIRLTLASPGPSFLRATWAMVREATARLRAETLRGVRRAFGIVYTVVADDSTSVRLDIFMDERDVDLAAMEAKWDHLTEGRGTFRVLRNVPPSPYALAKRLSEASRWFPRPGQLSLAVLQAVWDAMKGRRLTLNWAKPLRTGRPR